MNTPKMSLLVLSIALLFSTHAAQALVVTTTGTTSVALEEVEVGPVAIYNFEYYENRLTIGPSDVVIDYRTQKTFDPACQLKVTDLRLRLPGKSMLGLIKLRVDIDRSKPCGVTQDHHNGSLILVRGDTLPGIVDGHYQLIINGDQVRKDLLIEFNRGGGSETGNGFGRD